MCVYNNNIIYTRTGKRRFYWPMISTGQWQMTSAQISATAVAVKSGNRCVRLLQTPLSTTTAVTSRTQNFVFSIKKKARGIKTHTLRTYIQAVVKALRSSDQQPIREGLLGVLKFYRDERTLGSEYMYIFHMCI